MSTATATVTRSYTVVDIRRVLDAFVADLAMISNATGLMSRGYLEQLLADIKVYAEHGYISDIHIMLCDAAGDELRGRRYRVFTDASDWTSQLPGDNLWPRTPSGELSVVLAYSAEWRALGGDGQARFKQAAGFLLNWGPSNHDTSHPGLVASEDRRYSSNGWGLERLSYK
jgi:hypothetical protein